MNREIKFRVWDKTYKEMLYDRECMLSATGDLYLNHDIGKIKAFGANQWVVMMVTGLNDKNNKDIYEGDIIKFIDNDDTLFLFCRYDVTNAWFTFGKLSDKIYEGYYWQEISRNCEVIGNIFENPELL